MSPSTSAIVREATFDDARSIAQIFNQYIGRGPYTMESVPWTVERAQTWFEQASPRERLIVAEDRQKIVGWGMIKKYSDRGGYRVACEDTLYVDRRQTGRGYGRQLILAIKEQARQLGYHHMVAKIVATNRASIEFHCRYGFQRVGVQREIGLLDGRLTDVMILQCILGSAD